MERPGIEADKSPVRIDNLSLHQLVGIAYRVKNALVVAKSGTKLQESAGPRTYHTGRPGLIEGNQWSMTELADSLAGFVANPVADQTGLRAVYDLKLEWNPQELAAQSETHGDAPSLFTALQEQLGLKLESIRAPLDFVVVDHAERMPIPN